MKKANSNNETVETPLQIIYKLIQIILKSKSPEIGKIFPQEFIQLLLNRIGLSQHMNIAKRDRYYFEGYPDGDLLKQIVWVFKEWSEVGHFPINYIPVEGLQEESHLILEQMNKNTDVLKKMFAVLQENMPLAQQKIQWALEHFLCEIGPRGFLTCLGIRKTVGSKERIPPEKYDLFTNFNKFYSNPSQEATNVSQLTVGARALAKHAHRSSEGFWGQTKGNEKQRNSAANQIINQILTECVWINIHWLPHDEFTIEMRIQKGYGARWTINGKCSFRGFLEPQMSDGHQRKWRH